MNENAADANEQWMPCPKIDTEFPGLTYIYSLDEITIAEKADRLHKVITKEGASYTILNNQKQKVFLGVQQPHERHDLKIFNHYGNEVIHIKKTRSLICLNSIQVFAPPGNFVGSVEEKLPCLKLFIVKNVSGEIVYKLKARKCCRFEYDIFADETSIGTIKTTWNERNLSFREKNVGASFPAELNMAYKSVLIGACFLIGFLR